MRNWISDKFGRNRIRTRVPNTVPSPAPAPHVHVVVQPRDNVMEYWYRSTGVSNMTFISNPTSASWISRYYGRGLQWYDEIVPSYPEHLRLPDGA